MSGTFSSLSSALSALRYNRTAMDVASGNIANANVTGYARRQVLAQSTGAPAVPALWSRWDGAGDGVEATGVNRLVDSLLDGRSRAEHATSSFLGARSAALQRVEASLAEPGDGGVAAALTAFQSAWGDVANTTGDAAGRAQVLAKAETLRSTIATQAGAVTNEWSDQRVRLDGMAAETNQIAAQLGDLNRGLRAANVAGTDAGGLLDQRDQLTARLAELTGAAVTLNPDTTVEVTVGGQPLVSGNQAYPVTVTGPSDLAGAANDPVTFSVNGTEVTLVAGEVGATQRLLATDLPGYLGRLDDFVASMASAVNDQHGQGVDLDGAAGQPFFTGTTASTLAVAITDPRKVAAADPTKGGLDNTNARALSTLPMSADAYRNLITTFGTTVATANQSAANQATLVDQIDASREAVSGVNVDEEMVNLLAAQRGYEGAARVLTTMDSMLDTLINRTGLVH